MTFRPALRPGALLLRRDQTHLQVGTSPGIVVVDRPGLLTLLHLVDGARDVRRLQALVDAALVNTDATSRDRATFPLAASIDVASTMRELVAAGVVFDASRWTAPERRGLDAEARHVDFAGHDPTILTLRHTFAVAFHSDAVSRPIINIARDVLTASGVTHLDALDPDLLVLGTCGEPSRALLERLTVQRLDHLLVVIDEDRTRIGPLVLPGLTPCVSCHDEHRSDWDRGWDALLPQLGRHTGTLTPPAISAVASHAAALELAVEVLAHCDGGPSRTRGRVLVVGPRHDERSSWPVAFHHRCACDLLNAA